MKVRAENIMPQTLQQDWLLQRNKNNFLASFRMKKCPFQNVRQNCLNYFNTYEAMVDLKILSENHDASGSVQPRWRECKTLSFVESKTFCMQTTSQSLRELTTNLLLSIAYTYVLVWPWWKKFSEFKPVI